MLSFLAGSAPSFIWVVAGVVAGVVAACFAASLALVLLLLLSPLC